MTHAHTHTHTHTQVHPASRITDISHPEWNEADTKELIKQYKVLCVYVYVFACMCVRVYVCVCVCVCTREYDLNDTHTELVDRAAKTYAHAPIHPHPPTRLLAAREI